MPVPTPMYQIHPSCRNRLCLSEIVWSICPFEFRVKGLDVEASLALDQLLEYGIYILGLLRMAIHGHEVQADKVLQ